jgi:hypothetical protein
MEEKKFIVHYNFNKNFDNNLQFSPHGNNLAIFPAKKISKFLTKTKPKTI